MNEATGILQDARDLVEEPRHWTQGYSRVHSQAYGTAYCLTGAVAEVSVSMHRSQTATLDAQNRLAENAALMFPDRCDPCAHLGARAVLINDHFKTSHSDIIAVLDKAILDEPIL